MKTSLGPLKSIANEGLYDAAVLMSLFLKIILKSSGSSSVVVVVGSKVLMIPSLPYNPLQRNTYNLYVPDLI